MTQIICGCSFLFHLMKRNDQRKIWSKQCCPERKASRTQWSVMPQTMEIGDHARCFDRPARTICGGYCQ
jgi:hypothetical protein